jgi:hypothetical protein
MAEYPPPTEDLPKFNTIVFREATETDFPVVNPATNAGTYYPTFVSGTTGRKPLKVDTDLTYNPSTNTVTSTNITASNDITATNKITCDNLYLNNSTTIALNSLIIRASADFVYTLTSATLQFATASPGTTCNFGDMYL